MGKLNKTDNGVATLIDPGSDKPLLVRRTVMCCHCGGQYAPQPGSGRVRGWCMNCNGPVCGPGCAECVPLEVLLQNYEKGRPLDFRPIIVPTSFGDSE